MKTSTKSSKKVSNFLEKNKLHKKEFAQMIGVTLSYVYNIIDDTIPFSTRSTTIERIATVMDIMPEEFEEYVIEEDPIPYNKNLEEIKNYIKKNNLTTLEFLKLFERKQRLEIVDILRGKKALPIDFQKLKEICEKLKIKNSEIINLWKEIFTNHLKNSGFNIEKNKEILENMLNCANISEKKK